MYNILKLFLYLGDISKVRQHSKITAIRFFFTAAEIKEAYIIGPYGGGTYKYR